tara:strand:+ start:9239 stop:9424 length:186 start_codon:yes stop_codon:yes gene_type:complete
MRTDEERQAIIEQAEKEIQEVCSKYSLTFDATDNMVFLNHHEQHENGDFSIRGREVSFAPF